MDFYNKVKWVLGILMVFILIIATNLIDKNNFLQIKDSVVTIYEDRLVAKDILFEITKLVHEKELALLKLDSISFLDKNKKRNDNIDNLVSKFEETKLTNDEQKLFNELKDNLEEVSKQEAVLIQSKFKENDTLATQINIIKENLNELSKIQLEEGRVQMGISKKAIDMVELFTQIEIYFLILLAIIIQIIVIYKPKES